MSIEGSVCDVSAGPEVCSNSILFIFRYKAFRDNYGNYTLFYWELLAVRLGFIIAFEVRTSHLCRQCLQKSF